MVRKVGETPKVPETKEVGSLDATAKKVQEAAKQIPKDNPFQGGKLHFNAKILRLPLIGWFVSLLMRFFPNLFANPEAKNPEPPATNEMQKAFEDTAPGKSRPLLAYFAQVKNTPQAEKLKEEVLTRAGARVTEKKEEALELFPKKTVEELAAKWGAKGATVKEKIENTKGNIESKKNELQKKQSESRDKLQSLEEEKLILTRKNSKHPEEETRLNKLIDIQAKDVAFREELISGKQEQLQNIDEQMGRLEKEMNSAHRKWVFSKKQKLETKKLQEGALIQDREAIENEIELEKRKLQDSIKAKEELEKDLEKLKLDLQARLDRIPQIDSSIESETEKWSGWGKELENVEKDSEALNAALSKVSREHPEMLRQWLHAFALEKGLKEFSQSSETDISKFWGGFINQNLSSIKEEFSKALNSEGLTVDEKKFNLDQESAQLFLL